MKVDFSLHWMKKMYNEEQKIQEGVAKLLRWKYPEVLFTIFPAGFTRGTLWTRLKNGADAKRMGYFSGSLDMAIIHKSGDYPGMFLELKTWTGSVSKEQKEFIQKAEAQGYFCSVAHGYDHAKAVIDWYMNLKGGEDESLCPAKNDFSDSIYAAISRARRKRKASK